LIATIWPQPIVDTILDFPELERQVLAADLLRWLIHYVLLISIAAVLMGTLNSVHHFFIPAIAPLLFSVSVITSVLVLYRSLGVYAMVVGVLLGGIGQLLIQVPATISRGYSLVPNFDFSDPHFRRIVRRWFPVVSTASVFALNQQIALYFASGLEDGSGSAMTNALVFWQLPFGIFSASITTVLFPTMSAHHAAGDINELRQAVSSGLRGLTYLLIPSAIGLMVLGEPIIAVALQRGEFDRTATVMANAVLRWYSIGLLSVGAYTFLQRYFYAVDDYRTPLLVALATMVLDVALSLFLKETVLRVAGLSLANSLAFTVGAVLLLRGVAFKVGSIRASELGRPAVVALLASAGGAAAALAVGELINALGHANWVSAGSNPRSLGFLLAQAIPAVAAIAGVYSAFGVRPKRAMRGNT
jgi:putative peptidoglycan lipid II flippase